MSGIVFRSVLLLISFFVLPFGDVKILLQDSQKVQMPPAIKGTLSLGKLPLYLVENKGQLEENVKYYIKMANKNIFFAPNEIVYQYLPSKDEISSFNLKSINGKTVFDKKIDNIRVHFIAANKGVIVRGLEQRDATFNYFRGRNPKKWVSGARAFRKILYEELYPHIDLEICESNGRIKSEYRVKTGGDASNIRLNYEGVEGLRINEKGELEAKIADGTLVEATPLSYQIIRDEKVKIPARYVIEDERVLRIEVGEYKRESELVIDPLIIFSTYLGGSDDDPGGSMAVDPNGNIYVAGLTKSINFPSTSSGYDISFNGSYDAFITKFNSTGTSVIYSSYLGGGSGDGAYSLKVDSNGNAYIAGYTWSSDFPVTANAYNTWINGMCDVFITKLNSTGSALLYSTYLGGASNDNTKGIAIDGNGNVYIAGATSSNDFPTTYGAFDTGHHNIFITKLNSTGTSLLYSTFLGGNGVDYLEGGIAVDANGNVFVSGNTTSTDFPTTSGAYDTSSNGGQDVFLTKINSTGQALLYSTYLGGTGGESGWGVAIDSNGCAYIGGFTNSSDFPTTVGAYDTIYNGGTDGFIAKFNSGGTALIYATFLGGTNADSVWKIAVDQIGSVYATGNISSADFPITSDAYDTSYNGSGDVFIAKLNPSGNSLLYSTFLGGSLYDEVESIAIETGGKVIVAGDTYSTDFPTTPGAYDVAYNGGGRDIFVTKISISSKDNLLGTWDGQGVYFRDSDSGTWTSLATPADLIACGDLYGDGIDDFIGIWSGQAGVWAKNSANGTWAYLGSTPRHIATGDMNGDRRVDLLGTWDGQGVFYRNSISGAWNQMATPATLITAGDLDGDGNADLIGIWPSQAGVWVKYSQSGNWSYLGSSPRDIATGDMNGDGRADLIGTWDGQGVFYKDSISGNWIMMATPADQIAAGDLDGDGTDDLIGIWAGQAGVWVKYSSTGTWAYIGSSARDIAAGKMSGGVWSTGLNKLTPLNSPSGGFSDGPSRFIKYDDFSAIGPGGNQFLFEPGRNLIPRHSKSDSMRIPGPGEPGFKYTIQKNIFHGKCGNKPNTMEW